MHTTQTNTTQNALVFAATGAVASGVARHLARAGYTVWLSGRDEDRLSALAGEITTEGGRAETARVDATDPTAVDAWVDQLAERTGRIDLVFNGIGRRPKDLKYPLELEAMDLDAFLEPIRVIAGSQWITSRAAGRVMRRQGQGAIVTLSATLTSMAADRMANIAAACGAVEVMTKALAGELGPDGVRVNCVRASAMPATRTIQETFAGLSALREPKPVAAPPLGRPVTVEDTAQAVAFLASDGASGITGQTLTVCAGQFVR